MLYLDSSVLVSLFTNEDHTLAIQKWRAGLDSKDVCMSEWNITEFHSAMSFKRRTQQMSSEQRIEAVQLFERYLAEYPRIVMITSENFRLAASIAGRDDINIRAADALHLAVAESNNATICTLDKKMHQAASALGIDCLIP